MDTELTLATAFLVGLLGSTHCLGMCGGIVSALSFGLHPDIRRSAWRLVPYLLAYNLGRLGSYAVAGALAGAVGVALYGLAPQAAISRIATIISGGFMVALGLYLAGWWPGLQQLEKWGGVLWKRLEPVGRRFLPVDRPHKALLFGLVWGWLPCGLVYSVLAWALASGSASQGASLMLAFGLGTLPMLLAVGAAAEWLKRFVRHPWVRRGAALMVLLFGLYILFLSGGHAQHGLGHTGHVH